ncbi:protein KRBA1 [Candoia aspera]|uniref:protein KRBA1 n=1 Tax=Candoia aspera TaxID=51853 RepID=UPI002FD7B1AB
MGPGPGRASPAEAPAGAGGGEATALEAARRAPREALPAAGTPDRVTFEDVAVGFSAEEWSLLEGSQKDLHQEVMLEMCSLLLSLGHSVPALDVSSLVCQPEGTADSPSPSWGRRLPFAVGGDKAHCEKPPLSEDMGGPRKLEQDKAEEHLTALGNGEGGDQSSHHLCALMQLVNEIPEFLCGHTNARLDQATPARSSEGRGHGGPAVQTKSFLPVSRQGTLADLVPLSLSSRSGTPRSGMEGDGLESSRRGTFTPRAAQGLKGADVATNTEPAAEEKLAEGWLKREDEVFFQRPCLWAEQKGGPQTDPRLEPCPADADGMAGATPEGPLASEGRTGGSGQPDGAAPVSAIASLGCSARRDRDLDYPPADVGCLGQPSSWREGEADGPTSLGTSRSIACSGSRSEEGKAVPKAVAERGAPKSTCRASPKMVPGATAEEKPLRGLLKCLKELIVLQPCPGHQASRTPSLGSRPQAPGSGQRGGGSSLLPIQVKTEAAEEEPGACRPGGGSGPPAASWGHTATCQPEGSQRVGPPGRKEGRPFPAVKAEKMTSTLPCQDLERAAGVVIVRAGGSGERAPDRSGALAVRGQLPLPVKSEAAAEEKPPLQGQKDISEGKGDPCCGPLRSSSSLGTRESGSKLGLWVPYSADWSPATSPLHGLLSCLKDIPVPRPRPSRVLAGTRGAAAEKERWKVGRRGRIGLGTPLQGQERGLKERPPSAQIQPCSPAVSSSVSSSPDRPPWWTPEQGKWRRKEEGEVLLGPGQWVGPDPSRARTSGGGGCLLAEQLPLAKACDCDLKQAAALRGRLAATQKLPRCLAHLDAAGGTIWNSGLSPLVQGKKKAPTHEMVGQGWLASSPPAYFRRAWPSPQPFAKSRVGVEGAPVGFAQPGLSTGHQQLPAAPRLEAPVWCGPTCHTYIRTYIGLPDLVGLGQNRTPLQGLEKCLRDIRKQRGSPAVSSSISSSPDRLRQWTPEPGRWARMEEGASPLRIPPLQGLENCLKEIALSRAGRPDANPAGRRICAQKWQGTEAESPRPWPGDSFLQPCAPSISASPPMEVGAENSPLHRLMNCLKDIPIQRPSYLNTPSVSSSSSSSSSFSCSETERDQRSPGSAAWWECSQGRHQPPDRFQGSEVDALVGQKVAMESERKHPSARRPPAEGERLLSTPESNFVDVGDKAPSASLLANPENEAKDPVARQMLYSSDPLCPGAQQDATSGASEARDDGAPSAPLVDKTFTRELQSGQRVTVQTPTCSSTAAPDALGRAPGGETDWSLAEAQGQPQPQPGPKAKRRGAARPQGLPAYLAEIPAHLPHSSQRPPGSPQDPLEPKGEEGKASGPSVAGEGVTESSPLQGLLRCLKEITHESTGPCPPSARKKPRESRPEEEDEEEEEAADSRKRSWEGAFSSSPPACGVETSPQQNGHSCPLSTRSSAHKRGTPGSLSASRKTGSIRAPATARDEGRPAADAAPPPADAAPDAAPKKRRPGPAPSSPPCGCGASPTPERPAEAGAAGPRGPSEQLGRLAADVGALCRDLARLQGHVLGLEREARGWALELAALRLEHRGLGAYARRLESRCRALESRSRRRDLRLLGLPEGAEGGDAAGFLRRTLPGLLGWAPGAPGPEVESARRVRGGAAREPPGKPRPLVFRLLRLADKAAVLEAARARTLRCAGAQVAILPDLRSSLARRRRVPLGTGRRARWVADLLCGARPSPGGLARTQASWEPPAGRAPLAGERAGRAAKGGGGRSPGGCEPHNP